MLILCYHNVIADEPDLMDRRCSRLSRREFARQMEELVRRWRPVSLTGMLDALDAGDDDPEAVAITFDDAYTGVLEQAAPVLADLGIPAALFAPTDAVARLGLELGLHFHLIEIAFRLTSRKQADLEFLGIGRPRLQKPKDRVRAMKQAKLALKLGDETAREAGRSRLLEALEMDPAEAADYAAAHRKYRVMTPDELDRLHQAGWVIGSHTRTHRTLSRLSPAEQEEELAGSFAWLAARYPGEALILAYPYGESEHIGDLAPDLARRVGYRAALSTIAGANRPDTDRFMLRRVEFAGLSLSG